MKPACKGSGMVVLGLLALLAVGLLAVPDAQAFSYRKPITIDRTQVGSSGAPTTLSNYPFLYSVTDAALKTTGSGGHVQNANGYDIIFRAFDADNPGANICGAGVSDCTLDHEIESYTGSSGALVAWVRIPVLNTISASSNTLIYIYYGDSGVTSSTENKTGVWDTNFGGVWHLKEDPTGTAPQMNDSTANSNNGTAGFDSPCCTGGTAWVSSQSVAGQIANGLNFTSTGNHQYVSVPTSSTVDFGASQDFTVSVWVKTSQGTGNSSFPTIISKDDAVATRQGYEIGLHNAKTNGGIWYFQIYVGGTSYLAYGLSNVANGTWHHLEGVRSGSTIYAYQDGVLANQTAASSGSVSKAIPVNFGRDSNLSNGGGVDYSYVGNLDESRISNIARDQYWIKTEYNNMSSPSTFCTPACGTATEESNPPSLARLTHAHAISHDGVQTRVVQLEWRTSYEVDHLGFHVYREQKGERLRVTPALVAGSALKARAGTVLTAGHSYSWWDVLPGGGAPPRYWLEEVDLQGHRTWHGPVEVESAKGHRLAAEPERVRSVLLTHMGRGPVSVTAVPWYGTREASTAPPTQDQLAVQWRLAAGLAVKLGVQAEGWYHVSLSELVAAGLDSRVNPRHLQLFADGKEVPILVTGEQNGRVDPSGAIEFYGLGLDTPWTDTRTYWLVEGPRAGKRVGWVPSRETGGLAPLSFPSTLEWRPKTIYFAALLNGEADNFFGPTVSTEPVDQDFTLAHLDPTPSGAGRLEVTLQGVTDGLHQVEVRLNGSPVGTVSFEGMAQGTTSVNISPAQFLPGPNRVALVAQGGDMDISLVASVRLTYWRFYQAEEDVLEATAQGGDQVTITGFSSPQIRVLDVTQPDAVQAVRGRVKRERTGFAVTVVAPGSGSRALLAFTEARRATPASLHLNHPSQWHASGHGADLVILTHGDFVPSLASLQAWRQQQGLAVALIDVQEAYDEFNFGAKSPWALRALMQQARSHWARPPRFLLLAGDASVDPRNFMGMGVVDYVPTKLVDTKYLETSSDDWFGDLDNDGVPKIAVGRLAVQTSAQADAVVRKLIAYDRAGTGARAAVLVADHDDAITFEGFSDQVKALLPADVTVEEIYRGQMGDDAARAAVLSSLNSGPWLVNYFGHGSVEVWLGNLLSSDDARVLTNGVRLPFVVAMTCLNGFFHDVFSVSLAETLQTASQGGAVAVWASSGLTDAHAQAPMNYALMQRLEKGLTLGDMTAQAKAAASDPDVRRTWILFGDPTTRLH